MNIHIICFSPTGTSRRVADAIAEGMHCGNIIVHDLTLNACKTADIPAEDFAVIAAPVYGGKMAPLAKTRMEAIHGNGTPCAVVAVYGNRSFEKAVIDMAQLVKCRNFSPVAAAAFIGEHSYSSPETPIAVGRPDSDDLNDARRFGKEIADKISRGDLSQPETEGLKHAPDPEESLKNFKEFVIGYQQRQTAQPKKMLPETNTDLCTGCGTCITVCPTQAIAEDCISVDAMRCIKCCACVKSCPSGARTLASPFAPVLSANFSMRKAPVWVL